MKYEYRTRGTCSSRILFEVEDNKLKNVEYIGGCNGNLQGSNRKCISRLVEGLDIDEAEKKLSGIRCGMKETSCPDQLARAIAEYKSKK